MFSWCWEVHGLLVWEADSSDIWDATASVSLQSLCDLVERIQMRNAESSVEGRWSLFQDKVGTFFMSKSGHWPVIPWWRKTLPRGKSRLWPKGPLCWLTFWIDIQFLKGSLLISLSGLLTGQFGLTQGRRRRYVFSLCIRPLDRQWSYYLSRQFRKSCLYKRPGRTRTHILFFWPTIMKQ